MTDTIDIPSDIGRNDPCPCGSGKKYKKCHMRIHQAQKEAGKKTRSVEQLVGEATIPWEVYQIIEQANRDNLLALFHDLTHELGPLRARFADKNAFLLDATEGRFTLPVGRDYEYLRMRIDLPDVYLLTARGVDDPRAADIDYQLIQLRRNEFDADANPRPEASHWGWRVWDVTHTTLAKSELDDADIHLRELGVGWHPRGLRDAPTRQRPAEDASSEEE